MLGVTLAWDPSPDSTVVGYRIYQGSTSGTYTNMLDAGNVTEITLDNLVPNSQYYFAATSYTADPIPLESEYSLEVTYTATPMNIMVGVQLLSSTNATGPWSVYATLPSVSVPKSDAPQFFQSVVTITNQ